MEPVANFFKHNPSGAITIDWYIGKKCNFDCSYCPDYLHDRKSKNVPYDMMKNLVDRVYKENGQNIIWSFCGGEPTIHPKFMDLCKYVTKIGCVHSSVTTNGSRNSDYFLELLEYLDNITISFHFEFMHQKVDDYIRKCIEIEEKRRKINHDTKHRHKTVIYRLMVHPDYLEKVEYMGDALSAAGLENLEFRPISPLSGSSADLMPTKKIEFNLDPAKVDKKDLVDDDIVNSKKNNLQKFKTEFYLDKLNEFFEKNIDSSRKKLRQVNYNETLQVYENNDIHYNEARLDKHNNFKGWLCWAGIKHMKISPTGDVYIGSCHVGGKRGNIYDLESIDLPTDPIRCPKTTCRDNMDLKVPKIRNWKHYDIIKNLIEDEDSSQD